MLKQTFYCICTLVTLTGYTQEEKIIVIDRGERGRTKEKREQKLVDNEYVIKFSPLQMVMGEINLGFEKRINELSSVEFELGPTLSEVGLRVTDDHFASDPFGNSINRTTRMGLFASAGYRFYPMDNTLVLNNFYVSPVFKYRLFNFFMEDYSGNLSRVKGAVNQGMFTFNFGYQKWLSDHFSLDMFGGLGLCFESHREYDMIAIYDGNTGLYNYSWQENNYSGVRFAVTAGLKIGIGNE
jgi:hypothetical protein